MNKQPTREPSIKKQAIALAGAFLFIVAVAVAWRLGVFNLAAKALVDHSLNTMQKEVERQQNQPKTIVLKNGERIECKKVNDMNTHWGLARTDGKFSAVKKEDVKEIVDAALPPELKE